MTKEDQKNLFKLFCEHQSVTMNSKWDDYAGEDRLSNFKLAWSICWITPQQQCLSLIATKVARLGQLLSGKEPNNESIGDSILDLSLYSFLLFCLTREGNLPPQTTAI